MNGGVPVWFSYAFPLFFIGMWLLVTTMPLEEAERWLRQWEQYWAIRLDRLEAAIAAGEHREKKHAAKADSDAPERVELG